MDVTWHWWKWHWVFLTTQVTGLTLKWIRLVKLCEGWILCQNCHNICTTITQDPWSSDVPYQGHTSKSLERCGIRNCCLSCTLWVSGRECNNKWEPYETAYRHVTSHAILKFYIILKRLFPYELPCNKIPTGKLRAIKLKDWSEKLDFPENQSCVTKSGELRSSITPHTALALEWKETGKLHVGRNVTSKSLKPHV
jgi:hypothetical protein